MNDNKTKELIQKSVLQTSDAFTKELMEKIEFKKSQVKAIRKALIIACISSTVLLILITMVPLHFSLFHYQVKLPSIMIKIAGSVFVFTLLNKLLSLRSELS